jgi:hypothetical protein
MTNSNQPTPRQLTPVEIARKNLESKLHQVIVGGNLVRSNPLDYGKFGVRGGEAAYDGAMNSEEVRKMREAEFQKEKKEGQSLGVYGEPSQPTNYDISKKVMAQIEDYKMVVPLKDFGEIVKGIAPGFNFTVPTELENYVPAELFQKAQAAEQAGKKVELTEIEQNAFNVYQLLSQAYNMGLGLRAAQAGYFADLNQAAEQISEKYKPKEAK